VCTDTSTIHAPTLPSFEIEDRFVRCEIPANKNASPEPLQPSEASRLVKLN